MTLPTYIVNHPEHKHKQCQIFNDIVFLRNIRKETSWTWHSPQTFILRQTRQNKTSSQSANSQKFVSIKLKRRGAISNLNSFLRTQLRVHNFIPGNYFNPCATFSVKLNKFKSFFIPVNVRRKKRNFNLQAYLS